jgi:glycosyltransferase involved in cell wall biosynthesis
MKILLIAYYFPPDASSGAFRPLHFARYFMKKGDEVAVLTARVEDFLPEQPKDHGLVAGGLNIVRTRVFRPRELVVRLKARLAKPGIRGRVEETAAPDHYRSGNTRFQKVKDFITTALTSPDVQAGWLLPGVLAGRRAIRRGRPDLIMATGGPWTGLVMGAVLKRVTRCPLVLDFRDPWVSNPNFSSRPSSIQRFERWMEKKVLAAADLVLANTAELRQDFLSRYPTLKGRVETVPNGFENRLPVCRKSRTRRFTLTHAGNLYLSRNPVNLVRALFNLALAGIIGPDNFRVNFVGGIDISDPELDRLLSSPELSGVVSVVPRVPFETACQYQQESDLLLLFQQDFPLQVPRKLYESMAFGKPVLAITERNGATARVVRETGIGTVVDNRTADIEAGLAAYLEAWAAGRHHNPDPEKIMAYANDEILSAMHLMLTRRFIPGAELKNTRDTDPGEA